MEDPLSTYQNKLPRWQNNFIYCADLFNRSLIEILLQTAFWVGGWNFLGKILNVIKFQDEEHSKFWIVSLIIFCLDWDLYFHSLSAFNIFYNHSYFFNRVLFTSLIILF